MLLDDIAEALFERRVEDDQRLAHDGAALGAADIEHIAQVGKLRQGDVRLGAHQAVAHARAVDVQRDAALAAGVAQVGQFGLGVQAADLGREGDVNHARLDSVLAHGVGGVRAAVLSDLVTGNLAVHAGNRQHLVAGGLNRAGLVAGDVSVVRRQHALVRLENRRDGDKVGLGAAYQKMHVGVLPAAGAANLCPRAVAVVVGAVAGQLLHVGLHHSFQNLRVSALQIIAVKVNHCCILPAQGVGTMPTPCALFYYTLYFLGSIFQIIDPRPRPARSAAYRGPPHWPCRRCWPRSGRPPPAGPPAAPP